MGKQPRPQTQARQNAVALIQAAREAGWERARFELKPDGTTATSNALECTGAIADANAIRIEVTPGS